MSLPTSSHSQPPSFYFPVDYFNRKCFFSNSNEGLGLVEHRQLGAFEMLAEQPEAFAGARLDQGGGQQAVQQDVLPVSGILGGIP